MPDTAFDNESRTKNRGFETSDVNAPGLFLFVICFAVTLALMAVWLWWLLGSMDRTRQSVQRQPPPLTAIPVVVHPQPALQPSPGHEHSGQQDLAAMRETMPANAFLPMGGWIAKNNDWADSRSTAPWTFCCSADCPWPNNQRRQPRREVRL